VVESFRVETFYSKQKVEINVEKIPSTRLIDSLVISRLDSSSL